MKHHTMDLICCPSCLSGLSLCGEPENRQVDHGTLACSPCGRTYPIEDGIVRFIDLQVLQGSNQHFARFYNRLAPFYALFTRVAFFPLGGERKARLEVLDRLDLKNGRILEVSIGNGINLPYLFERPDAGEVYGLDISAGQLSYCRRRTNRRGWTVDLFMATAEALPFKTDTFDSVLHIGGINFFSDKKKAIDEMIRVARPGSKIVIADEAERLAKRMSRYFDTAPPAQSGKPIEEAIIDLVPDVMVNKLMEGIWRIHGRYHGYCLSFEKPA